MFLMELIREMPHAGGTPCPCWFFWKYIYSLTLSYTSILSGPMYVIVLYSIAIAVGCGIIMDNLLTDTILLLGGNHNSDCI